MAKRQPHSAPKPSDFLKTMCEESQKRTGKEKVYVATEHEKNMWGIPMPYLCLQWMFQKTAFLLQRLYGIAGKPHSCKSAFLYELMRWNCLYGGVCSLQETESKTSYSLMRAVIGDKFMGQVQYQAADTIDVAQQETTNIIEYVKKNAPHRNMLVMVGIDSLTGTVGDEQMEKIEKEGSADRGFPEAAMKYAPYFRFLSSKLTGWPLNVVFTNHRKTDITDDRKGDRTPGGDSQWFHASYYLWLDRVEGRKAADDSETRVIRLRTKKNSFGPNDREIYAPFRWWWDEEGIQRAAWDWDTATVWMLTQEKCDAFGFPTKLKGILSIKKETGGVYTCKELGMKDVTSAELGAAIHRDTALMATLQRALHIEHAKVYDSVAALDSEVHGRTAEAAKEPTAGGAVPEKGDGPDVG